MKVYGLPEHIKYEPDYSKYDFEAEKTREDGIVADLKAWLVSEGYTGKYTGEVINFGVADGYARYMFADAGRRSCLIHLPFGDAYQYMDVQYLPKAEIIRRLEMKKNSIFASRF